MKFETLEGFSVRVKTGKGCKCKLVPLERFEEFIIRTICGSNPHIVGLTHEFEYVLSPEEGKYEDQPDGDESWLEVFNVVGMELHLLLRHKLFVPAVGEALRGGWLVVEV